MRALFALVVALQPVQYLFIAQFGEPYPALTMPRFAGTLTDERGDIRARNVIAEVRFDDGGTAELSYDRLLAEAPVSHRDRIMEFVFAPRGAPSASVSAWKRRFLPGLAARYEGPTRPTPDPRTVAWLGERLGALFPGRRARGVTFRWFFEIYHTRSVPLEVTREPIGSYAIELPDAR
ncbi:MAG TPA: hypothetical protein VJS92_02375 [Candidatus Polarisedimenticolaceae bacterium]|nr:hypothetical protein [Candidatus Polarisedimenticolaceae bacterium]